MREIHPEATQTGLVQTSHHLHLSSKCVQLIVRHDVKLNVFQH